MPIPFNIPHIVGTEIDAIGRAIATRKLCGGGTFGARCEELLEQMLPGSRVLLTTSCTDALEIAATLLDLQPGDEVIAPSFTFVSSVNPFVMRGARVRFVDVEYPSLNASPEAIEQAFSPRTRAVIAVNYGGGCADLRAIRRICDQRGALLIEDAAQSLLSSFDGQAVGTFGQLAAISFHETKNIQCGEGGALVINDQQFFERAEVIREKGTNRSKFFRGQVDKYSWVDIGSSHIPSELVSAFLSEQLINAEAITGKRLALWHAYDEAARSHGLDCMRFTPQVRMNAHVFGVFAPDLSKRAQAIDLLKRAGVQTTFHYVPLHSSAMGVQLGSFVGEDVNTTQLSDRLIRLPLYPDLDPESIGPTVEQLAHALAV